LTGKIECSTASTLFQAHGTVKENQGQMRHADPATTLRYYVKVIPENQHKAVADFERSVMQKGGKRRSKAEPGGLLSRTATSRLGSVISGALLVKALALRTTG
jgi:hypothetical protein